MKTIEIRCSQERRTKGRDRKTRCNRYLGTVDEYSIELLCPNCHRRVLVVRTLDGVAISHLPPQDRPLISAPGDSQWQPASPSSSIPPASRPPT